MHLNHDNRTEKNNSTKASEKEKAMNDDIRVEEVIRGIRGFVS